MNYRGKPGKCITTVDQLKELADNRKSVAIMSKVVFGEKRHTVRWIGVTPARAYLNRSAMLVINALQSRSLYEYIKPTPQPRSKTTRRYTRKQGKREGIRRIIGFMLGFESDSENAGLMLEILEGLDMALANRIRSGEGEYAYNIEKAKAELKELEEL